MLRRWWRSTFGLVAVVALGFSAATLAIGMAAWEVTHEALELQLDHRIAMETSALLSEARGHGVAGLVEAVNRREASRSTSSLDYLLLDATGHPLAGGIRLIATPAEGYEEFLDYRRGDQRGVAQSLTTRIPGATLVVAADRSGLMEIDRTLVTLFSSALAAMLLLGIGAAGLVGWITRRRLGRIDATALAIIGGDFERRIQRDGSNSEFDQLAGTLNRMLDRIAGLMANLRQVSSDVAHDLRTPLTRLYAGLDHAAGDRDPIRHAEAVIAARAQAAELLEIFSALLRIAEVEGMAERIRAQPVDLSALLEQMVETYAPDMEASGHQLRHDIAPGVTVGGDRRLLSQLVANLLDNSLRHTPSGTTVWVRLEPGEEAIRMQVADGGPGVPDRDRHRLFERFARAESARSTPGHGLGLALVAAIANAHGGSVSIQGQRGFVIVIDLPRAVDGQ